jgi:hypothetical protein
MKIWKTTSKLLVAVSVFAMSATSHALTDLQCLLGSHIWTYTITATVTDYIDVSSYCVAGPAGGGSSTGKCKSSYLGKKKYSISGSLNIEDAFGLSAGWESEVTTGSECEATSTVPSCEVAAGVCRTIVTHSSASGTYCTPHWWSNVFGLTYFCNDGASGSATGLLTTITGRECLNVTPTCTASGCE